MMEALNYCAVWTAERGNDTPGFIIATRDEVGKRRQRKAYLVAHPYAIEWLYNPTPPTENMDISDIAAPNPVLVYWGDLPAEWIRQIAGNPQYGWEYIGPRYWETRIDRLNTT